MAEVKWIKFMVGTFEGTSFKRIKRAKIGGESFRDKLTAVWFELLDLAGKYNNDGFLYSNELPYGSYEDIATMVDRNVEEIELCMNFYLANGMVEIIDDFFLLSNWSKYQNVDGMERIREQTRARVAKYRAQKKIEIPSGNATCNVTVTQCNAPRIKNKNKKKEEDINNTCSKMSECEILFETFWKAYPRKVGKAKCLSWFISHKVDSALLDVMLKSITEWKFSEQWIKEEGRFIPHPLTWLNRSGWLDEVAVVIEKNSNNDNGGFEEL